MPPRRLSRYSFATAVPDAEGRLFLHGFEPFRYRDLPDNQKHIVSEGDTLWGLADLYYRGRERPAGLWWVIADFQPEPIHDPTLTLEPGRLIHIPSSRTLDEEVFSERRRRTG